MTSQSLRRIVRFLAFPLFPLVAALLLTHASPAEARYASIVIDADSGRVLHASNPDTRNYPASLTKMMTLYLLFEALESGKIKLSTPLHVSRRAQGMSPSKLGLKAGEIITVKSAILALVTKSANDAAVVIGEALGGTEIKFAQMMTEKARELGMKHTTYRNASGLPNRHQMSTARDIATLSLHLIRDFPQYYNYFSRESFTFRGRKLTNHNNLLQSYPGTDGIKTGYIRASGFNLAASAERNHHRLIGVVFGGRTAKSRDRHMRRLLEQGFEELARDDKDNVAAQRFAALSRKKMSQPLSVAQVHPVPPLKPLRIAQPTFPTPPAIKPIEASPTVVAQLDPPPANDAPTAGATATSGGDWNGNASQWSIQVGAYGDISPARTAARKAVSRIPKLTETTHISIAPYHSGDRLMYRARLIGMSESSAREACQRLERRRIPCIPIAPGHTPSDATDNTSQTAANRQ